MICKDREWSEETYANRALMWWFTEYANFLMSNTTSLIIQSEYNREIILLAILQSFIFHIITHWSFDRRVDFNVGKVWWHDLMVIASIQWTRACASIDRSVVSTSTCVEEKNEIIYKAGAGWTSFVCVVLVKCHTSSETIDSSRKTGE